MKRISPFFFDIVFGLFVVVLCMTIGHAIITTAQNAHAEKLLEPEPMCWNAQRTKQLPCKPGRKP